MLERHYLGVEVNEEYHRVAAKRLRDLEADLKNCLFPALPEGDEEGRAKP